MKKIVFTTLGVTLSLVLSPLLPTSSTVYANEQENAVCEDNINTALTPQKELGKLIYDFVFKRKWYIDGKADLSKGAPYEKDYKKSIEWFNKMKKETLLRPFIDDDGTGKNLKGYYIENQQKTGKTAIIAHGYRGNSKQYSPWGKIYYDMGYNILLPEARGHASSGGMNINFGWKDKDDYIGWVNDIIKKNGANTEIVLHGVSMGASTVMMVAGEKLPSNVKKVIADCGYTSLDDEINHLSKKIIPEFLESMNKQKLIPYIPEGIVEADKLLKNEQKIKMSDVSALKQIANSKTPILFITTSNDDFVPAEMTKRLYESVKVKPGMKFFEIKEGGHAQAMMYNLPEYKNVINRFLVSK